MNLDSTYIFFSLIWSIFGLAYFVYGKKQGHFVSLVVGIVLMVFPYFITETTSMNVVGVILLIIPWLLFYFKI